MFLHLLAFHLTDVDARPALAFSELDFLSFMVVRRAVQPLGARYPPLGVPSVFTASSSRARLTEDLCDLDGLSCVLIPLTLVSPDCTAFVLII